MRVQVIVSCIGMLVFAACGSDGGRTIAAPAPAPEPPAAPSEVEPATPAAADAPVATPAPAPFVLTAEECQSAAGRSYALMQRYDPNKLTAKQKQDVDAYAAAMEPESIEACRQNTREWYDCKMAAAEHFEAEDCNMIGEDADDESLP